GAQIIEERAGPIRVSDLGVRPGQPGKESSALAGRLANAGLRQFPLTPDLRLARVPEPVGISASQEGREERHRVVQTVGRRPGPFHQVTTIAPTAAGADMAAVKDAGVAP